MARTEHRRRTDGGKRNVRAGRPGNQKKERSLRRRLRREVSSTVGLLTDAWDFSAMRQYRTFTFDDHRTYLRQIEGLLRSLTLQGVHTGVALFDPEEFAGYCEENGLDPDSVASRSRFTARIAAGGAVVAYTGQSMDHLVPALVDTTVRRATWEHATMLLAGLGECADCGQDIGRSAFDRASEILQRLVGRAGPGTHHLVCSVPAADEHLIAVLRIDSPGMAQARFASDEGAEFVTVLAAGIARESPGGLVLRTTTSGAPDRLHGWRLRGGSLVALSAGEVFNAYCTDADTGEPLSPESDVEYCAGFDLGVDETGSHHRRPDS